MKKICKLVKLTIAAIAVGETIASYYKDNKFKEELESAKGFDKCKVILSNLVDLNKKFFLEVKEVDFKSRYEDTKSFFENKLAKFNLKVDEILSNLNTFNEERIKPLLEDLEEKANDLKNQLKSNIDDISEKIKLEEKIKIIESKIEKIREKFNK